MKEEMEESESPVTEEYIEDAKDGVSGLIPEDFEKMNLKVPTTAKDGSEVTMILTGKAVGGQLTDIYGASITPEAPKEEKKGRITVMIRGGSEEEED